MEFSYQENENNNRQITKKLSERISERLTKEGNGNIIKMDNRFSFHPSDNSVLMYSKLLLERKSFESVGKKINLENSENSSNPFTIRIK